MRLIGKNVPERNIIGKVMTCPTTLAVSVLLVTVPTSMPTEEKSIGPRTRNSMSHSDSAMCAPKARTPTTTISKKESTDSSMYQSTLEASHSILVRGVKDNCLNSFTFLYSEDMFTSENIGLTSMEKPTRPG